MSTGAQIDPHGRMRTRDVNRVARGEQAPRPAHEFGTVSAPPPPASVNPSPNLKRNYMSKEEQQQKDAQADQQTDTQADQPRHCYSTYIEYHRCIRDKGKDDSSCNKLASQYREKCPLEWIERWDGQQKNGTFPAF